MGRGSGGQRNQATRSQGLQKQSRSRMGNGMTSRVVAGSTSRGRKIVPGGRRAGAGARRRRPPSRGGGSLPAAGERGRGSSRVCGRGGARARCWRRAGSRACERRGQRGDKGAAARCYCWAGPYSVKLDRCRIHIGPIALNILGRYFLHVRASPTVMQLDYAF
jgi:hypothetical protein